MERKRGESKEMRRNTERSYGDWEKGRQRQNGWENGERIKSGKNKELMEIGRKKERTKDDGETGRGKLWRWEG